MQRRRDNRIPWGELAEVVSNKRARTCAVLDISQGGARLVLADANPGDELKLFLSLPIPFRERARYCCIEGRVVWADDVHVGIAFGEMPMESLAQLDEGIDALKD